MGTEKRDEKPAKDRGKEDDLESFDRAFDEMVANARKDEAAATAPEKAPDSDPNGPDSGDRVTPIASVPPMPPASSQPAPNVPDSKRATRRAEPDMGLFALSSYPPGIDVVLDEIDDQPVQGIAEATKALVSRVELPSLRPSPTPRVYIESAPPEQNAAIPGVFVPQTPAPVQNVPEEKIQAQALSGDAETPDIEVSATELDWGSLELEENGEEAPAESADSTAQPAAELVTSAAVPAAPVSSNEAAVQDAAPVPATPESKAEDPERPLALDEIQQMVDQCVQFYREMDVDFAFIFGDKHTEGVLKKVRFRDRKNGKDRGLREKERTHVSAIIINDFTKEVGRLLFDRKANVLRTHLGKFAAENSKKIAVVDGRTGELDIDSKNEILFWRIMILMHQMKIPEPAFYDDLVDLVLLEAFRGRR